MTLYRDVYIFDTVNGGDITKDLEIRDGLESSVYLSLFGGNSKDDGRPENPFKWWGNIGETVEARIYKNETAYLLSTVPPSPKNLRRIQDAAYRDLAWVLAEEVSTTLTIEVTMPARNNVKISIFLDGIDPLEFQAFWGKADDDSLSLLIPPPIVTLNNGIELSGRGLPNATLILVKQDGTEIQVPIDRDGKWTISPYPLEQGEVATIYVRTKSGLPSRGVIVVGVAALLYNGSVYYDGSQDYDGIKQ